MLQFAKRIALYGFVPLCVGCSTPERYTHSEQVRPPAAAPIGELPDETEVAIAESVGETVLFEEAADEEPTAVQQAAEPVQPEVFEVFQDSQAPVPLAQADGITVEELEQIALENNPAIRQLSSLAYRATGFRDQVGLYPNPTIGYSAQQLADAGTDQHMIVVDQEVVMGDKLWLNQQVLNAATRAQVREIEVQRLRVLTDVRVQFYEALGAQRRYDLAKEFEEIAARGVEIAEQRINALEGTRTELLQAQVLLNQVQLTSQQAEIALTAAWGELAAVAGIPHWTNPGLLGELEVGITEEDWDAQYAMLVGASPELAAARARVSAARANMERQQAQPIPNLLVNVGAGVDNGTNQGMINVGVGAPIPVFNGNEGNIRAAYGEYCSATHDVRRIEMSLRARLARTAQEYDSAVAAVQKYEDSILPSAQQSLELSEQAYSVGEADFLQVLVVRRIAFDTQLEYVQSLVQLGQARSRLNGLLLTGGLDEPAEFNLSDALRGQTFEGQ